MAAEKRKKNAAIAAERAKKRKKEKVDKDLRAWKATRDAIAARRKRDIAQYKANMGQWPEGCARCEVTLENRQNPR